MKTLLVTGGLGFIGSHFIKLVLDRDPDLRVINVDSMTYAAAKGARFGGWPAVSNEDEPGAAFARYQDEPCAATCAVNLSEQHRWIAADVAEYLQMQTIFERYKPEAVVHFAAESHVDRSIDGSAEFVRTNVQGTHALLEAARQTGVGRFLYVSTDEVYGPYVSDKLGPCSGEGYSTDAAISPRNPYAATKAAAEQLVLSYGYTHDMDVVITRGCNTYGTHQHPEKLLPLFIMNAAEDKPLPLYGDGQQVREWLSVKDHCEAIVASLSYLPPGEIINIGSSERYTNKRVAQSICELLGKSPELIHYVEDRPGHDRCYAIKSQVQRTKDFLDAGFRPLNHSGLADVVDWYTSDEGKEWCAGFDSSARTRRGLTEKEETTDEA
jgi:dTDP-glucose 4,6-dehydratase